MGLYLQGVVSNIYLCQNVTKFVPGELIVDIMLAESYGSPWQVTLLSIQTKTGQIFLLQLRLGEIMDIYIIKGDKYIFGFGMGGCLRPRWARGVPNAKKSGMN